MIRIILLSILLLFIHQPSFSQMDWSICVKEDFESYLQLKHAYEDNIILPLNAVVEKMSSSLNDSLCNSYNPSYIFSYYSSKSLGNRIVHKAMDYLGCKYGHGQSGPKRFDCSGFTSFIFSYFGMPLSRTSFSQFNEGTEVLDTRLLHSGDLVFWKGSNSHRNRVGHVGIVVDTDSVTGNFSFIHAAMTGIQIDDSSSPYYSFRFLGARRILK